MKKLSVVKTKNATGSRQSPVNIITKNLKVCILPPLQWGPGYFEYPCKLNVHADSYTVVLKYENNITPLLSGGILTENYKFQSIHFHWAVTSRGSEHTIDGFSYAMEMHVVHTKGNLSMEEAMAQSDGIVVLAYLFTIGENKTFVERYRNADALLSLTEALSSINQQNELIPIEHVFPIADLVIPFCNEYAIYSGSLTTTPFAEAVIWMIAPYQIMISPKGILAFQDIMEKQIIQRGSNVRELQTLNRSVYYDIGQNWAHAEFIKHKYYEDRYELPRHDNIFKVKLFGTPSFEINNISELHQKKPNYIFLAGTKGYFFETKLEFLGLNPNHYDIVIANFRNKKYMIACYKGVQLTYGLGFQGLLGVNRLSVKPKPGTPYIFLLRRCLCCR